MADGRHFYDRRGRPVYRLPTVSPKAKSKYRPPHIGDARRLGLLPGFSDVESTISNYQLQDWMLKQALLSALTLPREDGESLDAFVERVERDRREYPRQAAARGREIHQEIEELATGRISSEAPPSQGACNAWELLRARFGEQGWRFEVPVSCPLGYGCRVDHWIPGVVIADTKSIESIEKATPYPKHVRQLAANRLALEDPDASLLSVYVERNAPHRVRLHDWPETHATEWSAERGLESFLLALGQWKVLNNYDPSFSLDELQKETA